MHLHFFRTIEFTEIDADVSTLFDSNVCITVFEKSMSCKSKIKLSVRILIGNKKLN